MSAGGVTVAVATCGRPEALARCLAGLRAQNAPADELLVVDQAPAAAARAAASAGRRPLPRAAAARALGVAQPRARRVPRATCSRSPTTTACPIPAWIAGLAAALARGAGPGRRRRPDPAAARRAATRDLRDLAARAPRCRVDHAGGVAAVARRQRRELRRAGRAAARARRLGRAARHGLARPGGRGRRPAPPAPARRRHPCATSLRRSCGTSGSRARAGSPRAGPTPTGSARCAGSGSGAASASAARWLAGYWRAPRRPLLRRAAPARPGRRCGLGTSARIGGLGAGTRPTACAPPAARGGGA